MDLDGTLICTDLLHESALLLLHQNWKAAFRSAAHLIRGRAALKRFVANQVILNPASLPYHPGFLAWLKAQRSEGRTLVLATAADRILADPVAEYLGIFDFVFASDGVHNLKSREKAAALSAAFPGGFDYAGNSSADLAVWEKARGAVLVDVPRSVRLRVERDYVIEAVFPGGQPGWRTWLRALRAHQWAKNLLIFVPLIASHRFWEPALFLRAATMFAALSLCASSLYIANDLLDLPADRAHPRKRRRPFASGALSIRSGVAAMALTLAGGLLLAASAGAASLVIAALYAALSGFYSFRVKRLAILDVFFLAGLYVMRIVAGGVVTHIPLTNWLLAFAFFLFLGLAFCKRAAELSPLGETAAGGVAGRGYDQRDGELVTVSGIASSFAATLVLSLYIDSTGASALYRNPIVLWALPPLILFWQLRIWKWAIRGLMPDDPVMFALRDRVTWLTVAAALLLVWLAASGLFANL